MIEYTFETQYYGDDKWLLSQRRFPTWKEACEAANLWAEVSHDNGLVVGVRIIVKVSN